MIDNITDFRRGETNIDADQHRADHRYGIVGLEHRRGVRADEGHLVALADAGLSQGAAKPVYPIIEFFVGIALVVIDDCGFIRINHRGPADKMNRRQYIKKDILVIHSAVFSFNWVVYCAFEILTASLSDTLVCFPAFAPTYHPADNLP